MQRRNFLASAAAFFVAPKIPALGPAAPLTIPPIPATAAAPAVATLTNAELDRIYMILLEETNRCWTQRHREAYEGLIVGIPTSKILCK
jgi:hypothetical protein